jgi:hypothetical protein
MQSDSPEEIHISYKAGVMRCQSLRVTLQCGANGTLLVLISHVADNDIYSEMGASKHSHDVVIFTL